LTIGLLEAKVKSMTSFVSMFSGRKRGSSVWTYFEYNEQQRKSTCLARLDSGSVCNKLVATKNPTNLKNHLANHHEDVYKELEAREKEEKDAKKRMKTEGL
jgi:hypothetical protein